MMLLCIACSGLPDNVVHLKSATTSYLSAIVTPKILLTKNCS